MAVQVDEKRVTLDELMALGSDARVEVVNGEIVEMPPVSLMHSFVVNNVYDILRGFVAEHKLGYVFSDALIYRLDEEAAGLRGARVPDVSFVRQPRITPETDLNRPFPGAPDLAVEVMSPDDKAAAIAEKVQEYFEAGSEQVWVLYPSTKVVYQYQQAHDKVTIITEERTLTAESLFPGLAVPVRLFFALPEGLSGE